LCKCSQSLCVEKWGRVKICIKQNMGSIKFRNYLATFPRLIPIQIKFTLQKFFSYNMVFMGQRDLNKIALPDCNLCKMAIYF
jgi:hypothetical protein